MSEERKDLRVRAVTRRTSLSNAAMWRTPPGLVNYNHDDTHPRLGFSAHTSLAWPEDEGLALPSASG